MKKYLAVVSTSFEITAENIVEARRAASRLYPMDGNTYGNRRPGKHDRDFIRYSVIKTSSQMKVEALK